MNQLQRKKKQPIDYKMYIWTEAKYKKYIRILFFQFHEFLANVRVFKKSARKFKVPFLRSIYLHLRLRDNLMTLHRPRCR